VRLFRKSRGGLENALGVSYAAVKKKKRRKKEEESKVPSAERSEKDYWICTFSLSPPLPSAEDRGNPFFGPPLFRSPFLFFTYPARGIMTKYVEVIYRFYRFFDRLI